MTSDRFGEQDLLPLIQALGEGDVQIIGDLPEEIVAIWTKQVEGNRPIVLTGNRRIHYLEQHPDVAEWESQLPACVLDPDEIHRNRSDWQMAIFYKQLNNRHFLRVAVLMQESPGRLKHSVISARRARIEDVLDGRCRLVWAKQ